MKITSQNISCFHIVITYFDYLTKFLVLFDLKKQTNKNRKVGNYIMMQIHFFFFKSNENRKFIKQQKLTKKHMKKTSTSLTNLFSSNYI